MPRDLDRVPNEANLLRHRKHRTYYTNYYDPQTGLTLRKSTKVKDSLKEAKKRAARLYKEWVTAPPRAVSEVLFDDLAVEELANKKESPRRQSYLSARNQLRHLMKTFRGRRVCEMNKASFDEHVREARIKNPHRNLNDDRKFFIKLMRVAYSRGLIRIPVMKLPKPDPEKDIGRELNDNEINRLLEGAKGDMGFMIESSVRVGWRLREMLSCRYEYIDFARGTVKLPPTLTKTKRGREFPVAQDILDRIQMRQATSQSPYLFPSPLTLLKPKHDNKGAWKTLKRRVRVQCRWHDLRHTCATRMLRAGISEVKVSKMLGMSLAVLNRIYHHLHIDDFKTAADAVKIGPGK